jgi:hypothetical protein
MSESRTRVLYRVAALIAGLAVLIGAALVSVGVALCAPLGVWAARRVRRARGRTLDAWSSWIGAVSAVIIALILVAGVLASRLPVGAWSRVRQAADSASAHAATQPPPAWLDRLAPGAARYSTNGANNPPAFNALFMLFGAVIGVGIFGNIIGTLGWIGTMLMVFAASGRWLRETPAATIETDVT